MDKFIHLEKELGERRIKRDIPLSLYSTLKIGGPAKYLFEAFTKAELIKAILVARKNEIPLFVLGGGTNLLISDDGFPGLVIKNKTSNIKIVGYKGSIKAKTSHIDQVYLETESGVMMNRLVRFSLDEGLTGLENFLGQPGTVGGGIYMNAHNMNKRDFFGDHLFAVTLLTPQGRQRQVNPSYFRFGYDQSRIQKSKEVVISAVLKLQKGQKEKIWEYAKLAQEYRKRNQPQGVFSSGCAFRNIPKSDALRLATPDFTTSAGFLIEQVGLKGKRVGDAQVSTVHANFITNSGGRARALDVLKLIHTSKTLVKKKFGVDLIEEIIFVGFEKAKLNG